MYVQVCSDTPLFRIFWKFSPPCLSVIPVTSVVIGNLSFLTCEASLFITCLQVDYEAHFEYLHPPMFLTTGYTRAALQQIAEVCTTPILSKPPLRLENRRHLCQSNSDTTSVGVSPCIANLSYKFHELLVHTYCDPEEHAAVKRLGKPQYLL